LRTLLVVMIVLAGLVAFQADINQDIALETRRTLPARTTSSALPETIVRPPLSAAMDDPFHSAAYAPVMVAKPVEATPPPPPAPPPPAAPALNLQFIGRVTQADGEETVYMAYGDTTLTITEGQNLPNGYKVDAMTPKNVRFSHPQLDNPVSLDLPPPPAFQIR
jgi:hypothetical protein